MAHKSHPLGLTKGGTNPQKHRIHHLVTLRKLSELGGKVEMHRLLMWKKLGSGGPAPLNWGGCLENHSIALMDQPAKLCSLVSNNLCMYIA